MGAPSRGSATRRKQMTTESARAPHAQASPSHGLVTFNFHAHLSPSPNCVRPSSSVSLHHATRIIVAIAPSRMSFCPAGCLDSNAGIHSDAKATFPPAANNLADPSPPSSGYIQGPVAGRGCTIQVNTCEQLARDHNASARVPPGPRPSARLRAHIHLQGLQHALISPRLQTGISPWDRPDIVPRVQEPTSNQ